MVFTNDSGMPNTKVFGAVTLTAGTVSPTPAKYLNKSVAFSTYPAVSGEANTFYFCMVPGDTAGRLWISVGTSIPATTLPTVQPADTAPYRFGYVEFTYTATKTGTVDYSNVNDFDFPIDLQTYTNPGAQTPAESSTFTGNTCQIVERHEDRGPEARGVGRLDIHREDHQRPVRPDHRPGQRLRHRRRLAEHGPVRGEPRPVAPPARHNIWADHGGGPLRHHSRS